MLAQRFGRRSRSHPLLEQQVAHPSSLSHPLPCSFKSVSARPWYFAKATAEVKCIAIAAACALFFLISLSEEATQIVFASSARGGPPSRYHFRSRLKRLQHQVRR